jgi:hypothetical protein
MPPFKYIIQCRDMRTTDTVVVKDMMEFRDLIERYQYQFGPIDLLYRVC